MKRAILAALLVACVVPELARYQGERRLRMVDATMQAIVLRAKEPAPLLRRLSEDAAATRTYPGDWRPLVAAGSASYAAGDYAQAIELFERANSLGERPEIDINLGACFLKLGDTRRAEELFARALQMSPWLSSDVERIRTR